MKLLMPIGAVLIAIGMAGSAAACYGNSIFDGAETRTAASQLDGTTDVPADESRDSTPRLFLAPLAGLTLAIGLRVHRYRHRQLAPANPFRCSARKPWSDQPGEHGDPPKGLV